MDIAQFEDHIVTRLTEILAPTDEHIRALFETQAQHEDGVKRPTIVVAFKRTEFRQPYEQDARYQYSTDLTTQDATMYVEVMYKSTSLRGDTGIYGLRHRTIKALNSWKHPMADKLFPISDQAINLDGSVWMWSTVFACRFISVPEFVPEICPPEGLDLTEPPVTLQQVDYVSEQNDDFTVENPETDP